VQAPEADPRAVVILEGESLETKGVLDADDATIVGYGPNEVDLETSAKQPGYLVLSEVYYPGWRALVDAREVQVLRADYLFRAVALTAGAHRVRFIYDPLTFKLGAALSGLTILVLIPGSVYLSRRQTAERPLPIV
jgi:uncharacterized membrane protein YfhO